jgi:hypothetical protein
VGDRRESRAPARGKTCGEKRKGPPTRQPPRVPRRRRRPPHSLDGRGFGEHHHCEAHEEEHAHYNAAGAEQRDLAGAVDRVRAKRDCRGGGRAAAKSEGKLGRPVKARARRAACALRSAHPARAPAPGLPPRTNDKCDHEQAHGLVQLEFIGHPARQQPHAGGGGAEDGPVQGVRQQRVLGGRARGGGGMESTGSVPGPCGAAGTAAASARFPETLLTAAGFESAVKQPPPTWYT